MYKMNQLIAKQARKKEDRVDIFLIFLRFVEELVIVISDFGEQFDQQLNISSRSLRTLPRNHKGCHLIGISMLDHKGKLIAYQPG